ncbi:MAG: hypothetical protein IK057_05085 [Clostridia bacterium]|nr:hypothetical protein [Clostridia bacterium]
MSKYAYVTVMTNDQYECGVLALWHSVKKAGCRQPFIAMISSNVSEAVKKRLQKLMKIVEFSEDIQIDSEIVKDNTGFFEKWNTTFFKLKVLQLCEYDKIVMLDADMIVMKNLDNLFEHPHMSCVYTEKLREGDNPRINSGMMVLEPSQELYETMINAIAPTKHVCEGKAIGDQDVFEFVYSDWTKKKELHLEPTYNCYHTDIDDYIKNREFKFEEIYIIHYTLNKPWEISNSIIFKQILLKMIGLYKSKYVLKSNLIWKKQYRQAVRVLKSNK